MGKDLKEISKQLFVIWEDSPTLEQINTSALIRIANATEKMASNYTTLQNALEWHKKRYSEKSIIIRGKDKTISSLRGQNTKLRNKIKLLNEIFPDIK